MKYILVLLLLLYSCNDSAQRSSGLDCERPQRSVQKPLQKHSHLTLAQQAHQDPKKRAALRKQIANKKKERREAYRKNMEQRKNQIQELQLQKSNYN